MSIKFKFLLLGIIIGWTLLLVLTFYSCYADVETYIDEETGNIVSIDGGNIAITGTDKDQIEAGNRANKARDRRIKNEADAYIQRQHELALESAKIETLGRLEMLKSNTLVNNVRAYSSSGVQNNNASTNTNSLKTDTTVNAK